MSINSSAKYYQENREKLHKKKTKKKDREINKKIKKKKKKKQQYDYQRYKNLSED